MKKIWNTNSELNLIVIKIACKGPVHIKNSAVYTVLAEGVGSFPRQPKAPPCASCINAVVTHLADQI